MRDGIVLGLVCARGGSKGVPRKNVRMLAGRPLIAHAIECGRAAALLDELIVSTDDDEIAEGARRHGAAVPFMRPAALARDESSKWDVFRHVVRTWEDQGGTAIAAIVDLDSGVPMRQPQDIDTAVALLLSTDADVVATAYEPDRNPYFNMVECGEDGLARVVKATERPIVNRQQAPRVLALTPAVFAIRARALWQYDHWSQCRLRVSEMPRHRAIDVDSELDLQIIEVLMQSTESRGGET